MAAFAVFFAGLSRGFSGFGAALIAMPVLSILYGPVPAVVVMTLMEVPATALLLPTFMRQANWRAVMPLGIASLATIPLGAYVLVLLEAAVLQKGIGILVLIFAVLLATGWRYREPPTLPFMLGVGALSGLVGGAANMSGPIVVVFLLAGSNAAQQVRAGVMAYFSFSTLLRVAVYVWHGLYAAETIWLGAVLVPAYLFGIWTGSHLFKGVSDSLFRALVLVLIAGMGPTPARGAGIRIVRVWRDGSRLRVRERRIHPGLDTEASGPGDAASPWTICVVPKSDLNVEGYAAQVPRGAVRGLPRRP